MAERRTERWLRPRYIFPLLALIVLATILFTPAAQTGAGAGRLTSYDAQPFGARAIYEVAARLGWRVERGRLPFSAPMSDSATYLLLQPPIELSATEVSALLGAVRAGAGAIVVPIEHTPLADSLGVRQSMVSPYGLRIVGLADGVRPDDSTGAAIARAAAPLGRFDRSLVPAPSFLPSSATLVRVRRGSATHPAVMAVRMGAGRIIVLADPGFLRNAAVRDHDAAVLAIRIFEWLDPEHERPLVFDEYHQGFGAHQSMPRAVRDALLFTPPGRALLQLLAAGLLLLLVYGVRPIAPRTHRAMERRSPLEHVGALSRAYQQVEATRLATSRLLRGLRRRRPLGAAGTMDDEGYLSAVSARKPELAHDVALLRRALARPMPAAEWIAVGDAIDHIERTITQ